MLESKRKGQGQFHLLAQLMCDELGRWGEKRGEEGGREGDIQTSCS